MGERKIKIIIADGSEEWRSMLADLLTEEDDLILVGQTGSGEELLHLIDQQKPDVVVMDLMLAEADGLEVLERLGDKRPRTLVLSAFASPALARRAAAAGADYCMLKPCRLSAVIERARCLADGVEEDSPDEGGRLLERRITEIIHDIGVPAHIRATSTCGRPSPSRWRIWTSSTR